MAWNRFILYCSRIASSRSVYSCSTHRDAVYCTRGCASPNIDSTSSTTLPSSCTMIYGGRGKHIIVSISFMYTRLRSAPWISLLRWLPLPSNARASVASHNLPTWTGYTGMRAAGRRTHLAQVRVSRAKIGRHVGRGPLLDLLLGRGRR